MAESGFNLLEWYASHRGEVEVLRDSSALFALGLLDHVGETPRGEFQQDLGVDAAQLDRTIEKLYAAGFVATRGTTLAITPQGKQFLTEIGLTGPLPPPSGAKNTPDAPKPLTPLPERPPAKPPAPPTPRTPFWLWGLIGLVIVGILLVFGVLVGKPPIDPATRVAQDSTKTNTLTHRIPTVVTHTPTRHAPSISTPTPTTFEVPQTEIVFEAEPLAVAPGGCTILAWKVSNALEVKLGDEPVGNPGRQRVCLQETTTYKLTVISLAKEQHTKTVEVTVTGKPTNFVWTILGKNPPFDNLRLQNAMAFAVDEPAIAKAVLLGTGTLHNADPKLDSVEYDIERAQELMTQSKYDGSTVVIVPSSDDSSRKLADTIGAYLDKAGFRSQLGQEIDSRTTILVGPEQ